MKKIFPDVGQSSKTSSFVVHGERSSWAIFLLLLIPFSVFAAPIIFYFIGIISRPVGYALPFKINIVVSIVTSIAIGGLVSWRLRRFKSRKGLAFTIATCWLLLLGIGFGIYELMESWMNPRIQIADSIDDCAPKGIDLSSITNDLDRCEGFLQAGFQNSEAFYYQQRAKFKPEFCQKLNASLSSTKQRPAHNHEMCSLENLSAWRKVACKSNEYTYCFVCERETGNGNNIYYRAFVFKENCADGAFLALSERARRSDETKSKIGYFPM